MYQPEEWEPEDEEIDELEELEHKLAIEFPDYNETMIKEMAKQIHSATLSSHKQSELKKAAQEQSESKSLEDITQTGEKKGGKLKGLFNGSRDKKNHELFLLNAIEQLNVDIPDNREKFRAYFGGLGMQKKGGDTTIASKEKKEKYLDEDESPVDESQKDELSENRHFKKKAKDSMLFLYFIFKRK